MDYAPLRVGLRYDMRVPTAFGRTPAEMYAVALEQAGWADDKTVTAVEVTEHHGSADGYIPSPIVLATAFAARTRRLKLCLSALIIPLHDVIRIAEDLAVLDVISAGRLEVVIGAGYRPEEFAMFGRSIEDRAAAVEAAVPILRQAWTGQPFVYNGHTITVTPPPHQQPGPIVVLAGSSTGAARRAARIADGFFPTEDRFTAAYLSECAKLGREPGHVWRRVGPMFVHVAEDPDRDWARIAPHAMHETNSYAEWLAAAGGGVYATAPDPDALRASGAYAIVTPDECVALIDDLAEQGNSMIKLQPLMGGMEPELGWRSLELFVDRVVPALKMPIESPTGTAAAQ
jgi:alkanesulfonate monooxygenase SsuD/methylene tetrahydromethanopterin reductase-like flavin-dependent oxidoreductase (luciferase family)